VLFRSDTVNIHQDPVILESVVYGSTLEVDDFDVPPQLFEFCIGPNCDTFSGLWLVHNYFGQISMSVLPLVAEDWAHRIERGYRSQFRMRYSDYVEQGSDKYLALLSGSVAGSFLLVTYEVP
jgi:hypothetical protein